MSLFFKSMALALLCAPGLNAAPWNPDRFSRILGEHGVPADTNTVRAAALAGMLGAVDSGATLISPAAPCPPAPATPAFSTEELPESIGYLPVGRIDDNDGPELTRTLRDWHSQGRTGVIMDLRGAAGEGLDAAAGIAALFAPDRMDLFVVRNALGEAIETRQAPGPGDLHGLLPLILLVDDDTRGASEALASVLQSRCGVLVIGCRTRGDAAVRKTIPLDATLSARVAAGWVDPGPDGAPYDAVGVLPDVPILRMDYAATDAVPDPGGKSNNGRTLSDKARKDRELMRRIGGDIPLRRAADILLGLRALHGERTAENHPGF